MKKEKKFERWEYDKKRKVFVQTVRYENTYSIPETYEIFRQSKLKWKRQRELIKLYSDVARHMKSLAESEADKGRKELYETELKKMEAAVNNMREAEKDIKGLKQMLSDYSDVFGKYEKEVKKIAKDLNKKRNK